MEIVLRITDLLHSVSTLNLHFPNKPSPYSHDKVAYFHHSSGPPRSATLATVVLSLESVETGEEDFLYNLVLMVFEPSEIHDINIASKINTSDVSKNKKRCKGPSPKKPLMQPLGILLGNPKEY